MSLNQFVIEYHNTIITEKNCINLNLKKLLSLLNQKKCFDILTKYKLIPNQNRSIVFLTNKEYSYFYFICTCDINNEEKKILDDSYEISEALISIDAFSIIRNKKKLCIKLDYLNLYDDIKENKDIKNFTIKTDKIVKKIDFIINSKNIKKTCVKEIRSLFKKRICTEKFYNSNRYSVNLIFLDFVIQNIICDIVESDIYIRLKGKDVFVKLKSNKNYILPEEEKVYNHPLLPMSF